MRPRGAPGAAALLAGLLLPLLGPLARGQEAVVVKEASGQVFLQCGTGGASDSVSWWKDGRQIGTEARLDLGAVYDDPRGVYTCRLGRGRGAAQDLALQVHYRMCQNCIEVDAATVSGIVVADVVATVFLAIAVYCITGHDKGRMSRASDRQNLIANEQLYQPLGERDSAQYSRLAPVKARK
ncbi:T-cell surface glycoprotein CD3 delta chain [Dromaius novaehollandiae]|uniref:T-cell surface glycoprotein CD3 delta chain n=1 Tax=Dromaius novaehollandiae TaxID=8790 RepID=UPI00311FF356